MPAKKKIRKLIPILGDQLSMDVSSLRDIDPKHDHILMMEVKEEATTVPHHPHKIILLFSAMRHFEQRLKEKGLKVTYIELEDKKNKHSFEKNLKAFVKDYDPESIYMTEPSEYRVVQIFKKLQKTLEVPLQILQDDRFICSIDDFKSWSKDKKHFRMETFYRWMRQRENILMDGKKPAGGEYNFDAENRKPPKEGMTFKKPIQFRPDQITQAVIDCVEKHFKGHIGQVEGFHYAVTREEALRHLNEFIKEHLPYFGDYQDAMLMDEYHLHHSNLSMYLNIGLLSPREVIEKAEKAYLDKKAKINNAEGFIRQILGWREFVRGIYWVHMPKYKQLNHFKAKAHLPEFYWTGETDMACMRHALKQSLEIAMSHHIQRLMVTGNFAMLLGVEPEQVCEWYLAVYIDAFEWVELPNTAGMSQFADGGILGSKPYAASGNYINKMSNFCQNCQYKVTEKLTEDACPFNDLYWGFLIDNEKKLKDNPRMGFAFKHVEKMSSETKKAYQSKRKYYVKLWCKDEK